jgi:hypothetical protein
MDAPPFTARSIVPPPPGSHENPRKNIEIFDLFVPLEERIMAVMMRILTVS